MNDPKFFVHIPKTAGTSLRISASNYFGRDKVGLNYGLSSGETTDWVRDHICIKQDYFKIINKFSNGGCDFFTGHVNVKPYIGVFKQCDTFTIVRNPVDQVLSHYNHFCLHNNFKGSLEEFICRPQFMNVQSRMLSGYQPELMGYIGLTERYSESLEIINNMYCVDLINQKLNVKSSSVVGEVDGSTSDFILQNNREDVALYRRAETMHMNRYNLYRNDLPWTHGVVGSFTQSRIGGWAFSNDKQEGVEIELLKNNMVIGATKAIEFRPHLTQFSVQRNGFVGYSFSIDAKPGEVYEVKVIETGQSLGTRSYD